MLVIALNEKEVIAKLKLLLADPTMITDDVYSPAANEWPNNRLPFVERHLVYLRKNKLVNPDHYLSNLALIIKKR